MKDQRQQQDKYEYHHLGKGYSPIDGSPEILWASGEYDDLHDVCAAIAADQLNWSEFRILCNGEVMATEDYETTINEAYEAAGL